MFNIFTYEKKGKRNYIKKCSVCGSIKNVTFISDKHECTHLTCGEDFFKFNYENKTFGDMFVEKVYKKEKNWMILTVCNICGLKTETRISNFTNNAFNNMSHSICKKVLYKNIDDFQKLKKFQERWRCILRRCCDVKHKSYEIYKEYGICERWKDFMLFYQDMYETFKVELQIDRINGDLGYSKDNCRWVTAMENSLNRTTTLKCIVLNLETHKKFTIGETISINHFVEIELLGNSTSVYDRLNGKVKNKPYLNHMFFNNEQEFNNYLSVETKCN